MLAPASSPMRSFTWLWWRRARTPSPSMIAGGLRNRMSTSVAVIASALPARRKNGTPDHRQFSIKSRRAANVSVVESGRDALDRVVSLVLAAHVMRRVRGRHRSEDVETTIGQGFRPPRERLHRNEREHLEQMVLDHVAEAPDLVIEPAPTLDAEALRHRDLDRLDVLTVPQGLEHLVGEPEVHDVLHRLLPQEMIDPEDLVLTEDREQVVVELARRGQVVPERLLDHHPGPVGELRRREPVDDRREQRGRGLEVEQRMLGSAQRLTDDGRTSWGRSCRHRRS